MKRKQEEKKPEDNQGQKEAFKESEYKGDEEAEKEAKEENKKVSIDKKGKSKMEQQKVKPKNVPRPGMPITKISYYEYVIPKKKSKSIPNNSNEFSSRRRST